jgi:ribonuclease VapC
VSKAKYILDSFALLAFFQGEPAAARVREILKKASKGYVSAYLSVISLGEICYIIERNRGDEKAMEIIADIFRLPVDLLDATTKRVLSAAHIKACHPISYADAFVVAGAEELSATIVTGDPEFKSIEKAGSLSVDWLK